MTSEKEYIEKGGYIESVGRRKSAIARVRISNNGGTNFIVNNRKVEDYFPVDILVNNVKMPFHITEHQFDISVLVKGGGISAQSDAIRHGISRSLVKYDVNRKLLKQAGFLKRDPRKKERKKFGLKKARKAPQWSKR